MSKLAIITINEGNFQDGFFATVRIEEDGSCIYHQNHRLPDAPELPKLYQSWKWEYSGRQARGSRNGSEMPSGEKANFRAVEMIEKEPTNISISNLAQQLENGLNGWLNSLDRGVQKFREGLLDNLSRNEDVRFAIETNDETLSRLPWHRWDFFDRYDRGDVVLCFPDRPIPGPPIKLKEKVKILVILGESSDINVQADLKLLQDRLPPDAEILEPLIATSREKVDRALWDEKFDILFFAGHSKTDFENGEGKFYINETESLTVADLKEGLREAIAKGLKLAIFNSCDGIGLGRDLTDLQMPAIVVMREKIPDEAAQRFLEFFLRAFALDGKTLSAAVTEARKRLIGLEGRYPCASWLPVLCQHPEAEMLTWKSLREKKRERSARRKLSLVQGLQVVLLASFIGSGVVTATRQFGWWHRWELKAYDLLMPQRLLREEPDKRLLLITVDNKDVNSQPKGDRGGASLSDEYFQQLLEQLMPYEPRAIGSLIYRENPVGENNSELANLMQSGLLFGICKYGSGDSQGISAPPEIPENRQGYSNVLQDSDGIIRRHLLAVGSPEPCQEQLALSFQLAIRYLADEGITPVIWKDYIKLGDVPFITLEKSSGGYHNIDARGHQVMVNYRNSEEIAKTLTLRQVLRGDFDGELVRDRIVLIGTTDPDFNNHRWLTPYSGSEWPILEFTGVEVQAHMISQILSAVLDDRPLIGWWSDFGENLWIWWWSLLGATIPWRFNKLNQGGLAAKADSRMAAACLALARKGQQLFGIWPPLPLVLAQGGVIGVLYGSCLLLLTGGTWVPLLPSAFASVIGGGIAIVWINILDKRQQ
ncbi:MAG: CHASE2 domain-containing protein [Cyanobacteriota bacterium]|nr:CHASE2 domain-containing protein [Cyanobacteriota bacterium]